MYKQWLYFFNSPIKEVNVKNKKEKQTVTKEWLDDGGMKISGSKPSEWSVVLQPIITTDLHTLKYDLNKEKLEAKDLFKRAFRYRNKSLFKEGETKYVDSEKIQKEINELIQNDVSLMRNKQEKIFQIRRNLYLTSLQKNVDSEKVRKLSSELEEATLEQIKLQKSIRDQEYNYVLKTQSVVQKGPIPTPPTVKHLSLRIRRMKFQFKEESGGESEEESGAESGAESEAESEVESEVESGTDADLNILDDITKIENNTDNEPNITSEPKKEDKKGGYIKIIKLS